MAEVRQLKTGQWRLYRTPNLYPVRDPETGRIATFESFAEAQRWFNRQFPSQPPAYEGVKCAKCGAYFAPGATYTLLEGLYYHLAHAPRPRGAARQSHSKRC